MFDNFLTYLNRFSFSDVKLIGEEILDKKGESKIYPTGILLIVNEAGREEMIARLDKEIENERNEIMRSEKMLSNPNFIAALHMMQGLGVSPWRLVSRK